MWKIGMIILIAGFITFMLWMILDIFIISNMANKVKWDILVVNGITISIKQMLLGFVVACIGWTIELIEYIL